ncbi:hypothetical protein C0991_006799 [Blastosporella zonata]|nr:hypothetical protein C0991_006799 [Blastosporella zonata]
MVQTVLLNEGWSWKQRDTKLPSVLDELGSPTHGSIQDGWRVAQAFPSEVHVELLKAGLIPDPYVGFNEHKVQWIGDVEWLYKCSFSFIKYPGHEHAILEFEGLDTICDVYLNGTQILSTDNQFRTYSYPISLSNDTNLLKETNTLFLHFKSAKALAKAEEAKYGKVRAGSTNLVLLQLGLGSLQYSVSRPRTHVLLQGPELMTAGPYRPITLKTYSARLNEVHTRASVSFDKTTGAPSPSLKVDVLLEGSSIFEAVEVVLKDSTGKELKREQKALPNNVNAIPDVVVWNLSTEEVKLWWPVGYGEQNLYDVQVSLIGLVSASLRPRLNWTERDSRTIKSSIHRRNALASAR